MKKLYLLVLMLVCVSLLKAQQVVPIDHIFVQVPFDSLRVQYPDRVAYLNELKQLVQELDVSKSQIDQAKKQLKDEKTHFKNASTFIKERTKELQTIEKSYANEKKVQDGYLKLLDKQHNAVSKETYIDKTTRDNYIADLNHRRQLMEETSSAYEAKTQKIKDEYELLKTQQIDLAQYDVQIKEKETTLKQMEATLKNNQKALKDEIKATSSILKAQN